MCISLPQSFLSFRLNKEFYLTFEPFTIQSTAKTHFEKNNGFFPQLYLNLYTFNDNDDLSSTMKFVLLTRHFYFV